MPKGRIYAEACDCLEKAGYVLPKEEEASRKLIMMSEDGRIRVILSKPVDVPTYVEYGAADVGIAGKDVLLESGREVYEMLDLKISVCHLAVAALPGQVRHVYMPRVATKYPNVATRYFKQKGEQVEIIPLNGSIELAPQIGLADRIVDIVSSGRTLEENGLVEMDILEQITSRFIVNPVSYRLNKPLIDEMIQSIKAVVEVTPNEMDDM
jgi:ATP phosphoribosyltransferase